MTDYNNGQIWGWNGGECPVHPETVVKVFYRGGASSDPSEAGEYYWQHDNENSDIIAFRVVTPYVEPQEYKGECYAYHYTSIAPTLCGDHQMDNTVKGTYTATHIGGKLARIVWEVSE